MCGRCDCCDEHALDCQCANKYNFNKICKEEDFDRRVQRAINEALFEIHRFAMALPLERLSECVKFHVPLFSRKCIEKPFLLESGCPPCTAPKTLQLELRCSVR